MYMYRSRSRMSHIKSLEISHRCWGNSHSFCKLDFNQDILQGDRVCKSDVLTLGSPLPWLPYSTIRPYHPINLNIFVAYSCDAADQGPFTILSALHSTVLANVYSNRLYIFRSWFRMLFK